MPRPTAIIYLIFELVLARTPTRGPCWNGGLLMKSG